MFQNPFSFEGRIRRSEYGLSFIIYFVVYFIIFAMMTGDEPSGLKILGLAYIPAVWFLWAQGAKRCHDLGNSGWWQIIPFYGLWMLFQAGKPGTNEYGDNPKGLDNPFDPFNPQPKAPITDGYNSGYNEGHNNPNSSSQSNPINATGNQQSYDSKGDGYTNGELYK